MGKGSREGEHGGVEGGRAQCHWSPDAGDGVGERLHQTSGLAIYVEGGGCVLT